MSQIGTRDLDPRQEGSFNRNLGAAKSYQKALNISHCKKYKIRFKYQFLKPMKYRV